MSTLIELLPLVCTRCQTAIPAKPNEIAWVCQQCGQGLVFSEEKGAVPLVINFAAGISAGKAGVPFWVATGQVQVQRQIFGGGDQARDAYLFWQAPHRFFIPAYDISIDQMVDLGTRLLQQNPALQAGSPSAFLPVTLNIEDVRPAAEFIVIGIEAARKDKIKEIQFTLNLSSPELWILP
jgi:hypothetical protein